MGTGTFLLLLGIAALFGVAIFFGVSKSDDQGSAARVNAEWLGRKGRRPALDEDLDPAEVPLVYFQRWLPAGSARHELRQVTLGETDLGPMMTFEVRNESLVPRDPRVEIGWCALAVVPTGWPPLAVLGPSHLPGQRQAYGSPVRLDLGEFERRHDVTCDHESFARSILGPEVREWWLGVDACQVFEIGGGYAVVSASPAVPKGDRSRIAGEWLTELLRRARGPLRDAGFG